MTLLLPILITSILITILTVGILSKKRNPTTCKKTSTNRKKKCSLKPIKQLNHPKFKSEYKTHPSSHNPQNSKRINQTPNTQTPQKEPIKSFVRERKIEYLFHFTNINNVPSIIEHGLIGRETIQKRNIHSDFNDPYRFDNVKDSISTSISFPLLPSLLWV